MNRQFCIFGALALLLSIVLLIQCSNGTSSDPISPDEYFPSIVTQPEIPDKTTEIEDCLGPDLTVLNLQATDTLTPNSETSILVTIRNDGSEATTENVDLLIFFYYPSETDDKMLDYPISTVKIKPLQAGETRTKMISFIVPDVSYEYTFLTAWIDPPDTVSEWWEEPEENMIASVEECNEYNNGGMENLGREVQLVYADLQPYFFSIPPAAETNASINVGLGVENIEAAYVTNMAIDFRLSTDETWDETDELLGSTTLSYLSGYDSTILDVELQITNSLAPGDYYLITKINAADSSQENNLDNNYILKPITLLNDTEPPGNCRPLPLNTWFYANLPNALDIDCFKTNTMPGQSQYFIWAYISPEGDNNIEASIHCCEPTPTFVESVSFVDILTIAKQPISDPAYDGSTITTQLSNLHPLETGAEVQFMITPLNAPLSENEPPNPNNSFVTARDLGIIGGMGNEMYVIVNGDYPEPVVALDDIYKISVRENTGIMIALERLNGEDWVKMDLLYQDGEQFVEPAEQFTIDTPSDVLFQFYDRLQFEELYIKLSNHPRKLFEYRMQIVVY